MLKLAFIIVGTLALMIVVGIVMGGMTYLASRSKDHGNSSYIAARKRKSRKHKKQSRSTENTLSKTTISETDLNDNV